MKRFHFHLETVLRYRARREEDAVREQAGAEARKQAKEGALARTRNTLAESLAAPDTGYDPAERLHTSVYRVQLGLLAARQEVEVQEASLEWALCRERTIALHRDRLVLEKLKEKKKAEHAALMNALEQKEYDEISLRLAKRADRPEG